MVVAVLAVTSGGESTMKRLLVVFIGMAITLAVALNPQTTLAASDNWQKAVLIQPRSATDFSSSSFQQSVSNAVANGANYINMVVPVHQSNIYSTDVQTGWDTPTDQSLRDAVQYIHSRGVKAAISIHVNPYDNQWRALINPSDRATWFKNYGAILNRYASLGQQIGLEEMVLGTELTSMTSPEYNSTNTANWNILIQDVRNRFSGLLTYSSQHAGYMSDTASIGFWGKLDYIGVSAYFGMGGSNPSVDSMKSTWNQINMNSLQAVSAANGKSIIFTEVGYQSKSNSLNDPGTAYQQSGWYDPQLQANAYQALMEYWNNYSYFAGVFWWDWSSDPNAGGNGNVDYTPQNKLAQDIMKTWFTKGGTSTPTTPTAPSIYATSAAGTSSAIGGQVPIMVKATSTQSMANAIVDVEIYNSTGQRVSQTVYENQTLTSADSTYTVSFTPPAIDTYTVKVGIFTANWQQNPHWNDTAGSIIITAAPTTPTVPTVPTTPTIPTTPPPTQPTTPTTPPSTPSTPIVPTNGNISIWWPGSSQAVSGIQPFKAVVDGVDLDSYTMFWQVDGGSLNQMDSIRDNAPHKEATVDLSGWRWNPNRTYTISFVAKNSAGTVIATKSTVITVNY